MRIDEGKMKVQTALRTARGPARCTIAAIRIRAPLVFCMIGAASYAWRSAQRRSPGWGPGLRNLLSPRVDEEGASQVQKMDRAICRIVPVRRSGAQRDAGAAGLDPAPRLFVEIECSGVAGRLDHRQRPADPRRLPVIA